MKLNVKNMKLKSIKTKGNDRQINKSQTKNIIQEIFMIYKMVSRVVYFGA